MNTVNYFNPIKYFILVIASFNLLSQEVDPNFINGIPEDFKKEILKEIFGREKNIVLRKEWFVWWQ